MATMFLVGVKMVIQGGLDRRNGLSIGVAFWCVFSRHDPRLPGAGTSRSPPSPMSRWRQRLTARCCVWRFAPVGGGNGTAAVASGIVHRDAADETGFG